MKRFFVFISVAALVAYVAISAWLLLRHGCIDRGYHLRAEQIAYADSIIEQGIAAEDYPGAVLCVVQRAADSESMGRILYLKAYGNRQVTSGRNADGKFIPDTLPMTTNTIFDLASLSKSVSTTLAFMTLVERGQVRLSDRVERYIPSFKPWESKPKRRRDPIEREHITIEQLLTHTSGLPAAIHVPDFLERYEKWGEPTKQNLRDSLVQYLAVDAERLSRPSEKMRYSCLNFITLQAIIERVTSTRMDRYAAQEIFEPMKLQNTWYNHIDETAPFTAQTPIAPTELLSDGTLLKGEVHDPTARIVNRGVSGNAGLFSTAEDLATIVSMLMNGGVIRVPKEGLLGQVGVTERVRILSEATVQNLMRVPPAAAEHGRTMGWVEGFLGELTLPQSRINHTGYTGTSISIDQERGVAIILLTNRVHPTDDGSLARLRAAISNIVLGALD